MSSKKDYQVRKFSLVRQILSDYNDVAAKFPRVKGFIEIDVTNARKRIQEIREKDAYKVSFTGWTAKCIAKAVMDNKRVNSFRKRRKIIVFDNVDISIMIELLNKDGKRVPYNHVIRRAETKSVKDISDEIREIQNKSIDAIEQLTRGASKFTVLYLMLPRFFRRFVIKKVLTNPFRIRKLIGTVGITSFGENVKLVQGWADPFGDRTLNIGFGGLKDKLVEIDGKIKTHEVLCSTFLFDHNLVDGAPAARFIGRVSELMMNAYGLEDIEQV